MTLIQHPYTLISRKIKWKIHVSKYQSVTELHRPKTNLLLTHLHPNANKFWLFLNTNQYNHLAQFGKPPKTIVVPLISHGTRSTMTTAKFRNHRKTTPQIFIFYHHNISSPLQTTQTKFHSIQTIDIQIILYQEE